MGFNDVKTPTYVSVEKDTAHFSVKRQNGEQFTAHSISGFLVGIDYINATYENRPAPKLSLKFIDHTSNEDFLFQTSFMGSYAQTIMNCLAGVDHEHFGVVGLSLVEKDGKTRMRVHHNENHLQWKYKTEQMPAVKDVEMSDGSIIKDYGLRTKWFRETVLPQVQEKLPLVESRRELVQANTEPMRQLSPPSQPNADAVQWHRQPAALSQGDSRGQSTEADYVPFPVAGGSVAVPRRTSSVYDGVPPHDDSDIPF